MWLAILLAILTGAAIWDYVLAPARDRDRNYYFLGLAAPWIIRILVTAAIAGFIVMLLFVLLSL